jgi:UDP-N-acetylglucosamine 2-epimerase (non-hydrolysing)
VSARRTAPRVFLVAGTRPECLKLASLATALRRRSDCSTVVVNSGQHPAMVAQTFAHLGQSCDTELPACNAPTLSAALRSLRAQIRGAACAGAASILVAQGDTSTAYATALAARDLDLPLAHVEAGLRTDHPLRPFPEEYFRRCISRLATLHLAPTHAAATNLRGEGVASESIHLVGNTVVDLLREQVENGFGATLAFLPDTPRIITLTLHRRENYGRGLDVVCTAILDLLARETDIGVVCPVHPNPVVGARIRRHLASHPRIRLTEPLAYRPFIALLARSTLVVTDSGGIQEEAPYLGVPVLVVRENTERPESVAVGTTTLVPVQHDRIIDEIERRLASARPRPLPFAVESPYGDGRSGERCAERIAALFPMRIEAQREAALAG